tara:strand:- start:59 stop:502 length:444 start_codon:yes stop_codon:yes gene_type:complete
MSGVQPSTSTLDHPPTWWNYSTIRAGKGDTEMTRSGKNWIKDQSETFFLSKALLFIFSSLPLLFSFRMLVLRLENSVAKSGMRKLMVFCKYWFINKTGLRLLYKQMYMGYIAAGQSEVDEIIFHTSIYFLFLFLFLISVYPSLTEAR